MSDLNHKISELKPILSENLKENILKFWTTKTVDTLNGGFIGLVNSENEPVAAANKGAVLNTRILWAFSAAAIHFNSQEYRDLADRAYNYVSSFFTDKTFGGVYWELDCKGNVINPRKQIYAQAFAIYAFAEYYKLTGNPEVLRSAVRIFNLLEKYSYEPSCNGYLEALGENWTAVTDFRLSNKDLNTPFSMNTHLHVMEAYTNLYRVWKADELHQALVRVTKLFPEKFIDKSGHLVLFFDNHWKSQGTFFSYGHDIEFAWLVSEAAHETGDAELISQTDKIAVEIPRLIMRVGLDSDGGLFYGKDFVSGSMNKDKEWWPQAEAMVAFAKAYRISGDRKFQDALFKVWTFTDKHIVDHNHGEWFLKVDLNGKLYPGQEKAGFWKCPYHNTRAMIKLVETI